MPQSSLREFMRRGRQAQNAVDQISGAPRFVDQISGAPRFKDREGCAPGICRVCGCTQERACANICSWVTSDLCSTCATAIAAVQFWMEHAYRPAGVRLIREARERAGR